MLHGIEVRHNGSADTHLWTYIRNGSNVQPEDLVTLLSMYYTQDTQAKNNDMSEYLIRDFERSHGSCKDLQYNLHLLQKPAFEVPNPCILNTFVHKISNNNNVVPVGAEGTANRDANNEHNFRHQYENYIKQDEREFEEQTQWMIHVFNHFFGMYEHFCSNWQTVTPVLPAATYIQNNQTEIAAIAYHGNLFLDKIKGGRDEVRCVGHLGNSFPGCACIREGKGMLNTYQSMPTAVHVL
jgi:hypothetical protein